VTAFPDELAGLVCTFHGIYPCKVEVLYPSGGPLSIKCGGRGAKARFKAFLTGKSGSFKVRAMSNKLTNKYAHVKGLKATGALGFHVTWGRRTDDEAHADALTTDDADAYHREFIFRGMVLSNRVMYPGKERPKNLSLVLTDVDGKAVARHVALQNKFNDKTLYDQRLQTVSEDQGTAYDFDQRTGEEDFGADEQPVLTYQYGWEAA
jgi:hypothetical protein